MKWFRGTVFRNLWKNTKPESRQSGNVTDALFHMKSESITAEALQLYAYDPETFSESDLPGFSEDDGDDLDSQEQPKADSAPTPELPAQVLSSKRRLESSDELQQNMVKRARVESRNTNTNRQHVETPSLIEGNVASKVPEGPSSQVPGLPQELPPAPVRNKRRPEPSDELEQHAAKRPRKHTAIASTEREEGQRKLLRCKRCVQMKKGVCDRQRPCNDCKAAGIDIAGCTGEEQGIEEKTGSHLAPSTDSNTTASESKGAAQRGDMRPGLDTPQGAKDMGSDEVEVPTAFNHTTASLGKRKREMNDNGIDAGLIETQASRVSGQPAMRKRQATESSIDVSDPDGEAIPPAPMPKSPTLCASNVTNGKNAKDTESSAVLESFNTAPNRQNHKRPVNWADVSPLDKQMKKIR